MKTWIIYAILSMTFGGATAVIAKFGMKNITADAAVAVRTTAVFGLVWMNVFVFNRIKEMEGLTRSDVLFLCLSAVTTTLSWLFYYRAVKEGQVAVVAAIDKASIVVTILLSLFLLREPLTWKLAAGAGLILAGTFILIWK
jgi:bacterial/archaeal transporter family protein